LAAAANPPALRRELEATVCWLGHDAVAPAPAGAQARHPHRRGAPGAIDHRLDVETLVHAPARELRSTTSAACACASAASWPSTPTPTARRRARSS
jgi:hypothetical protein